MHTIYMHTYLHIDVSITHIYMLTYKHTYIHIAHTYTYTHIFHIHSSSSPRLHQNQLYYGNGVLLWHWAGHRWPKLPVSVHSKMAKGLPGLGAAPTMLLALVLPPSSREVLQRFVWFALLAPSANVWMVWDSSWLQGFTHLIQAVTGCSNVARAIE